MKFRRYISAFMLLMAVWLPLDNAVASAIVEGCPMMSHAFEQGLRNTYSPNRSQQAMPPCHYLTDRQGSTSPVSYHCVNGCEHCSLCLLLGAVALPITVHQVPVTPTLPESISALIPAAPTGVAVPLFRPPII